MKHLPSLLLLVYSTRGTLN